MLSSKQKHFKVFNLPILIGLLSEGYYIRFGNFGFEATKKPKFSVREGYKKSIKIGKYYIIKL